MTQPISDPQLHDEFKKLEDLVNAGVSEQTGQTIMTTMKDFIKLILLTELAAKKQLETLQENEKITHNKGEELNARLLTQESKVTSVATSHSQQITDNETKLTGLAQRLGEHQDRLDQLQAQSAAYQQHSQEVAAVKQEINQLSNNLQN